MSGGEVHLVGTAGMFEGVRAVLRPGERLTIGRSRFVEMSAVKTPLALRVGRQKLEHNSAFRRLSRRHLELDYADGENVVLKNLSRNGLVLDGARVSTVVIPFTDFVARPRVLRFGANEEIRIEHAPPGVRQPN